MKSRVDRATALSLPNIGMSIIAVIATMQNMRNIEAPKRRAQKACPTYQANRMSGNGEAVARPTRLTIERNQARASNAFMNNQLKKKQHFVSQFYLKNWSMPQTPDKVYVNIKNAPALVSVRELANSQYFYKIEKFSLRERDILLRECQKMSEPLKGLLIKAIDLMYDYSLIPTTEESNRILTNTIEDIYCIVEEMASPCITSVIERRYDDVDLNDYQNILRYTVFQLGRTPGAREKFCGMIKNNGINPNNFKAYQIISSIIQAEIITLSLIEKLYVMNVYENITHLNYITSDSPARNLMDMEASIAEIFLPLAANTAVVFKPIETTEEEKAKIKERYISLREDGGYFFMITQEGDEDNVDNINKGTATTKKRFIYAKEAKDIEKYLLASS